MTHSSMMMGGFIIDECEPLHCKCWLEHQSPLALEVLDHGIDDI